MHITADRRMLTLSQARNQPMVVLYATSLFSVSFEARCLRKVLVSGLALPEAVNTRGVNEACSTSRKRSLYTGSVWHGDGSRQQRRRCGLRVR